MNLPNVFVNAQYDAAFLLQSTAAFKIILQEASKDSKSWSKLIAALNCHGLLLMTIEKKVEAPAIEWDATRLGDSNYRRYLIRELSKPIPHDFEYRSIKLEIADMEKPELLEESAGILAYMWARKILPASNDARNFILLRQNAASLRHCLFGMNRAQSSADAIAQFIMQKQIMDSIDQLDAIKNFGQSLAKR